jgi:hypothetical protein
VDGRLRAGEMERERLLKQLQEKEAQVKALEKDLRETGRQLEDSKRAEEQSEQV